MVSLALVGFVLAAPVRELDTRQSCSTIQLVHLAGTNEEGLGLVGEPLSAALASAVPGTAVEYVITVAKGATLTEDYLASQVSKCPSQRFVLSGYSKGALVVHSMRLPNNLKNKVLAILVFGDPARNLNKPWPIDTPSVDLAPRDGSTSSQNIASFCNKGDIFCDIGAITVDPHLAYGTDGSTTVAAIFVKSKI
ncbi:cutinase [Ceratobasidium sp. AG-Ba]|nr:cutinase [Ceratobasidium sp. AG-Ba]